MASHTVEVVRLRGEEAFFYYWAKPLTCDKDVTIGMSSDNTCSQQLSTVSTIQVNLHEVI